MPSTEQLEGIRAQVEGLTDDELAGARWAIHPRDLEALRDAVGDVERALFFPPESRRGPPTPAGSACS
jgi:hypothetical protein